jgi:non-ribosomal peptide synthetase component E (peptide arylation enzyme)
VELVSERRSPAAPRRGRDHNRSTRRLSVPALGAKTLCEAFQTTASERPFEAALRTRDDERVMRWSEYAGFVRRLAAGFAGMGLQAGDTLALMLVNCPEFHVADSGRCTLV